MKVLHLVEFYEPVKGGAQEVVRQISERLVRRGHDVTVATMALPVRTFTTLNGVKVVGFELSGNSVKGLRGNPSPLLRFIEAGNFDVIMSYAAQTWHMDTMLENIEALKGRLFLASCGFSGLYDPDFAGYFDRFADRARHARAVIVHSNSYRDATFLRDKGLDNLVLIPNGAGEEFDRAPGEFRTRHNIPNELPLLLTVGSHTGMKGHLETIAAFRRSWIGRATLLVNGNVLPGAHGCTARCRRHARRTELLTVGRKNVRVVELTRDELLDAFFAADLFVFLSRIECAPLVLYEACAAGLPFVTSDVGNAAEIARDTGAGLTVKTRKDAKGYSIASGHDAARKIRQLIADPQRRRDMAAAGRNAWRTRYHWDLIASQYERLYNS
jgi:glycosyltransferase involved in cell wall biosynthesis